jgi:hypothetical protein
LATVTVVLAGVLGGALGLLGISGRAAALDRARAETAHQVRLQTVRTKLVIADTAAGDDVLRGRDQQRLAARQFDYALQPATNGLVIAAEQPDDAAQLAVANRYLAQYVMQIDHARTLAGLGRSEEAAGSLKAASALLQRQVLPRVLARQNASQVRLTDDEGDATRGPLIALLGVLLALLVLAGVHWWVTLHTRRVVNVGLATGLLLVIVVTATGTALVAAGQRRAHEVQQGPRRVVQAVVQARIAAFDARSSEARAVASADVPGAEAGWQSSMRMTRAALNRAADAGTAPVRADVAAAAKLLQNYAAVHTRLLADARAGRESQVVNTAISPTVDGSVGSFEDFDATSGALLARQVQLADDGWAAADRYLIVLGWLVLATGLVAAASGWRGLAVRGREYR